MNTHKVRKMRWTRDATRSASARRKSMERRRVRRAIAQTRAAEATR